MIGRSGSLLRAAPLVVAIGLARAAFAEPFVPDSPDRVLAELPSRDNRVVWSSVRSARKRLSAMPDDLGAAAAAARASIELSRSEADQRYLGHAEAAIARWLEAPDPPAEILVLGATIKQSRHDFAGAIADLERAVEKDPSDMQAWLTLASVRITRGQFGEALTACEALGASLPGLACASLARGMTGALDESYEALLSAYRRAGPLDPGLAHWILGLLAEMAERLGRPAEAGGFYDEARRMAPLDSFMVSAFADYLLDNGRHREARELLEPHRNGDAALLRLAIAYKALGEGPALETAAAELASRLEGGASAGDVVHGRELAIFLLDVKGDARAAVSAARANWEVQREAVDVRVLAESAAEAGDSGAAALLLGWLGSTGYRDARLAPVMERLERLAGE